MEGASWGPRLERGFHDHWRLSGLYRHEIVGNMTCSPAQKIMHPNWSDLAGQRPGGSLARLGLGKGPALPQPGGWGEEWPRARRPVPAERKGKATAAPGRSAAEHKSIWGGMVLLCAQP